MAELSRFFNSVGGDRKYMAEEFADFFHRFLTNGVYHTNFIPTLAVKKDGEMSVKIEPGSALINGYMYKNTSDKTLNIDAGDTFDRIDRVVLRLDRNQEERSILSKVIKGEPAQDPEPPELTRDNSIHEISLAQVYVTRNVTSITSEDITDERMDKDVCGLVRSMITDSFAAITDEVTGHVYTIGIENRRVFLERVT